MKSFLNGEGSHEPIIDKETCDIVQYKVGRRVNFGASHKPNIFARIARCADCGWILRCQMTLME